MYMIDGSCINLVSQRNSSFLLERSICYNLYTEGVVKMRLAIQCRYKNGRIHRFPRVIGVSAILMAQTCIFQVEKIN